MVRIGWIRRIVVVSLLAPLPVALADPYTTQVEWNCPQSSANGPGSPKIRITLDPDKQTVDISEYQAFLDRLAKDYPKIDYFGCAQTFIARSQDQAWDDRPLLEKLRSDQTKYQDLGFKLATQIANANSDYAVESYKRAAVSPLEPGSTATTELPLREMRKTLREQCGWGMDGSFLDFRLLKSLADEAVSSDWKCQFAITRQFAQLLLDSQLDVKQCEQNPGGCQARKLAISRAIELLDVAGLAPYAYYVSVPAYCGAGDDGALTRMLQRFAAGVNDVMGCVQLNEGESRNIDGNTGTGLYNTGYVLTRTPDVPGPDGKPVPSYRATVAIKFTDAEGKADPKLQQRYEAAARRCYAEAAPYLIGKSGALEIKLAGDEPSLPKPKAAHTIGIAAAGARSTAANWAPDMDQSEKCSTVLHETLHLLGLVDEYHEAWIGTKVDKATGARSRTSNDATTPDDDCRVLGPESSMMVDQGLAYLAVKPYDLLVSCNCGSREAACIAAVDKAVASKGTSCPSESNTVVIRKDAGTGKDLVGRLTAGSGMTGRVLAYSPMPAERDSLLFPAQFRAITQPGCRPSNKTYLECASEAYTTSRGNFGGTRCAAELPSICRSGGADWLQ